MRPPSVSDVLARRRASARLRLSRRPRRTMITRRTMIRIGARGHAAKLFLFLFVTALAVTKQCVPLADARLVTAAMPAARPFDVCAIANVSGWLATGKRDVSSTASSIKPGVARGVPVHPSTAADGDSLPGTSRFFGRRL